MLPSFSGAVSATSTLPVTAILKIKEVEIPPVMESQTLLEVMII
jgi:hypothetical protein